MPCYTNFFWATFFILYDPLEFSTGACPTPSGLEMAKTHHCVVSHSFTVLFLDLFIPNYQNDNENHRTMEEWNDHPIVLLW